MIKTRRNPASRHGGFCVASLLLLSPCVAVASDVPPDVLSCAAIQDNAERLICYDRFAGRTVPPEVENAAADTVPADALAPGNPVTPQEPVADLAVPDVSADSASRLAKQWELYPQNKRGVFNFRPHRKNYLIATYNPSPNEEPYRPYQFLVPGADGLSKEELAFQLGFKLKGAENVGGLPVDLWFGYTQHSYWQIGNSKASSPFRETNYQPEVMAVMPLNIDLLGWRLRFLNAGLVHQSNGQASTLSRSWNRIYLQAGLERDDVTLLARVWDRIDEDVIDDDNPDIIDYMGRGDVQATYYLNGHEMSLLARYNFSTGKGAAQLGWAFPLVENLKGFVQVFSGYGYSLIDYNEYQRVYGLGFQVEF